MDEDIASRLLASIHANRLVILCGAGLSMAPPSNLPSATRLAQNCAAKYSEITGQLLDNDLKTDLERLAEHFRQTNEFQRVFIQQLIPWREFRRKPNGGHEAIADFVTSGVVEYGITTNLDTLIEIAANKLGETDFCSSVNPSDLNRADLRHRQFIKLHGCCLIDRPNTIWCKAQLDEAPISQRIARFKEWITANLRERDLLIIGFWSDWGYLNSILEECVSDIEPRTVILVDPSDELNLQSKAPIMWSWATNDDVNFFHVQESGSDFLDDLRRRFCLRWLINLITRSTVMYEQIIGHPYQGQVQLNANPSTKELYSLRCDYSGVPSTEIPFYARNDNNNKVIGVLHLLLLEKGGGSFQVHIILGMEERFVL